MSAIENLVMLAYYGALILLVCFGAHRLWLTVGALRAASMSTPRLPDCLPFVTVQLPMFNERAVAERVIRAAAALDYPRDRLEIQVLDDSNDDTRLIVDRVVASLSDAGVPIAVVRRDDRVGYKAGALAAGLDVAKGTLVAIFDADFVPRPGFLRAVVGHFENPEIGLVQARWGHLNRRESWLTRAQAVLLDGHFIIEQPARASRGALFNFNGTAGVWRRQAIDEAGGWAHDTITEDLDLSYRAQLLGWRFVYRSDLVAPAELPAAMTAFKSQQHRWAKGSIECLRKLAGRVMGSDLSWSQRLEALIHLGANASYLPMVVVAVAMPLQVRIRQEFSLPWAAWADATLFALGFLSVLVFYGVALRKQRIRWGECLTAIPLAIALDIGMCLHKTRAVFEAIARHRSAFVRTPKAASEEGARRRAVDARPKLRAGVLELVFAGWLLHGAVQVFWGPHPSLFTLPFLALFGVGFSAVGLTALSQGLPRFQRRLASTQLADQTR